ncbi:MAG: carbohydrate ABC transporter permease [Ruminococcus sp.]|nr:carbohydrate ABC transporter permease [Ruminococcus sp.]
MVRRSIFRAATVVLAILFVIPTAAAVVLSFADGLDSYTDFFIWEPQLVTALVNSIIIASLSAFGSIFVSLGAAYVFSFHEFKGKGLIFYIYIIVMMMPFQVTLLSQYIASKQLHIYDSPAALIFLSVFSPFAAFLLTQIMKTADKDMIAAAKMDTSSEICILAKIIIPTIRPGIICAWILVFCEQWNTVAEPLVLMETKSSYPLSVLIDSGLDTDLRFAAASIYMILPLLLYMLFESEILSGLGEYKL